VINQLYEAIVKTLADPEVKKRIENVGGLVAGTTPAEFATYLKKELAVWAKIGAEIQALETTSNR
jgi:tripartite-type tricarboxylate transporter receptor subunit TctC